MADVGGAGQAPARGSKPPRDRRRDTWLVVVGIATVMLVWFAVDNRQSVPVHFWVHTAHAPIFLVVIITAALSVAVTWLVMRRRRPSREGRS